MKKIYGFAALCAAMTLASCSNNDEPIAPVQKGEMAKGYITVTLATPPTSAGTRAEDLDPRNGTYVQGSPAESSVSSALLITFNNAGTVEKVVPFTPKPWYDSDEVGVDKTSSTNVIEVEAEAIEIEGEKVADLKDFITVLNISEDDLGVSKGDAFDDVRKKLDDYSKTTNGIVMTTSAYNDSDTSEAKLVYSTDIEGKIYKDLAEASKPENEIKVYVERAVGGVDIAFNKTDGFEKTPDAVSVDGSKDMTTMDIKVTGVTVANQAEKAYLVKDIDNIASWNYGFNTANGFTLNAKGDHRSHWADNARIKPLNAADKQYVTFKNFSYNTITGDNSSNSQDIVDSYTQESRLYLNENTSAQPSYILITAELNGGNDIYRLIANGKYYSTEPNVLKAALGYLEVDQYFKKKTVTVNGKEVEQFVSLDENDIELKAAYNAETGLNGYDGYIQFKPALAGKIYKRTGSEGTEDDFELYQGEGTTQEEKDAAGLAAANAELIAATCNSIRENAKEDVNDPTTYVQLKKYRVYKWNKGRCYYYTPIKPEYVGVAGVVRNHIYSLTLSGVKGMGVPVFDPEKVIIPEAPDKVDPKEPDNYYIKATINILDWTFYTQNVIFDTPQGN